MKKLILTFVTISFSLIAKAQGPVFDWSRSMGGTSSSENGTSVAIDNSGNVLTTGFFTGSSDFDPGTATFSLSSSGSQSDCFVTKFDAFGNFNWAKRVGGTSYDAGWCITADGSGNVIVGGHFEGTVDFDPGSGVFNMTSAGAEDGFVLKLDPAGNFLWAKRYGTVSTNYIWAITADNSGNIYTAGWYDSFITKMDASGNTLWTKNLSATVSINPNSIKVDASGNVYTGGHFQGTADLDPGIGVTNVTCPSGSYNAFVIKFDASGNFIFGKGFGDGAGTVGIESLDIDPVGNIYSTGVLMGSGDFDPGAGVFMLYPTAGSDDGFICKLDVNGDFLWAQNVGGSLADVGRSIAVDASGNIYATGLFGGAADFDPGPGTDTITTSLGSYILKLSTTGNYMWAKSLGNGTDAYCIKVDAAHNIYTTGSYAGTLDFNLGSGVYNMTSVGGNDIFVHKMKQFSNGIEENPGMLNMCVYPNPTGDMFIISMNINTELAIEVSNIEGVLIYKEAKAILPRKISLGDQPAGIYFAKVINGNKIIAVQKIIKQ